MFEVGQKVVLNGLVDGKKPRIGKVERVSGDRVVCAYVDSFGTRHVEEYGAHCVRVATEQELEAAGH